MITIITLQERCRDIRYARIVTTTKVRTYGETVFRKYFRSNAPPSKPTIKVASDQSGTHEFLLKPTVFKSGKEGFAGISFFDGLIVRANISHSDDEPEFFLLTVVFDSIDNDYNNKGDENEITETTLYHD